MTKLITIIITILFIPFMSYGSNPCGQCSEVGWVRTINGEVVENHGTTSNDCSYIESETIVDDVNEIVYDIITEIYYDCSDISDCDTRYQDCPTKPENDF